MSHTNPRQNLKSAVNSNPPLETEHKIKKTRKVNPQALHKGEKNLSQKTNTPLKAKGTNQQLIHRSGQSLSSKTSLRPKICRLGYIDIDSIDNDKKNLYKIDIDNIDKEPTSSLDDSGALARKIAGAFNDEQNLPLYLNYCRKYPKEVILEGFRKVKEIPQSKIRKTRGALFNYLVQKYVKKKTNQNPGH